MARPKGSKDKKPRKPRPADREDGTSKLCTRPVPAYVPGGKVNAQEARFISEYLVDKNGTKAAIRAGYAPASAASSACNLLKRAKIKDAIQNAIDAQLARTTIKADKVLVELANIAFSRPTAIMSWGPGGIILRDSESMSPDDVALVSEVSETKGTDKGGGSMKVKLHDKMKALELLGRYLGMFAEVQKVQVQDMGTATHQDKEEFSAVVQRATQRWMARGHLSGKPSA